MISLKERRQLISEPDELSISKQCDLLSISRSTLYYKPCAIHTGDLSIMRIMDEMYLEDPTRGTRRYMDDLALRGIFIGRDKIRTLMRIMKPSKSGLAD
jgi:putative transposase